MARYIDSDALKKHIRHRFMRLNSESKIGLKECKEIDAVIDEEKEIKVFDRDDGAEPILETKTGLHHELHSWVNYTVGLANGIFRTNYLSAQGVVKRLIGRSLKRKKKDGMNLKKSVKGRRGLIKQDTYLIT